MEFVTKQGNTYVALKATLESASGSFSAVSDVRFRMAEINHTLVIDRVVNVWSEPDATVVFTAKELEEAGTYLAEFVVEYNDGKKEHIPSDGYIKVTINKAIRS